VELLAGAETQIRIVRNAGDERMPFDLAEADPYVRSLAWLTGQMGSRPKGGSLCRISEEGALLRYLRLSRRDEAQPQLMVGGAWALKSAQSSCPVRATSLLPLEQTHTPSATTLCLLFQVQHQSRGRVHAFRPTPRSWISRHHYRPRTATAADVRSPPIDANDVNWLAPLPANIPACTLSTEWAKCP
jgi:hypothetical protein